MIQGILISKVLQIYSASTVSGLWVHFRQATTPADSQAVLGFFLEYDVSVTDPQFLIHDLRHAFSFTSIGSGSVNLITQAGFPPDVNASIQSVEGFWQRMALSI